ncbi:hypothetical protein AQI95_06395 [Streptomyces yokosukanensis]|uniref:Uncharacterized protein n=1 Tax=Streptomyces yokosukanensis TaxID=67386 RepID=A0A124HH91_9ACTN|nr:hypothetical protein [Streptomyces yokosukanensis]KUN09429.1 hypothetical protein AQI95_06395 [Streptomyces yokosukanensis]
MLVALLAIVAQAAALVVYTVRNARGAGLPSLGSVDLRNLILATMATATGYALTRNQDLTHTDLVAIVLTGCVLPAQAGAAVRHLVTRWTAADWLIACAGGLAVGSLNQNAAFPWS